MVGVDLCGVVGASLTATSTAYRIAATVNWSQLTASCLKTTLGQVCCSNLAVVCAWWLALVGIWAWGHVYTTYSPRIHGASVVLNPLAVEHSMQWLTLAVEHSMQRAVTVSHVAV